MFNPRVFSWFLALLLYILESGGRRSKLRNCHREGLCVVKQLRSQRVHMVGDASCVQWQQWVQASYIQTSLSNTLLKNRVVTSVCWDNWAQVVDIMQCGELLLELEGKVLPPHWAPPRWCPFPGACSALWLLSSDKLPAQLLSAKMPVS